MTPIRRRQQVQEDIEQAADYYFHKGGMNLELRFIDAVEAAIRHIAAHPPTGSSRYADWLGMPGLRCWPIHHFPYLVFYIEHAEQVDVWRLLHAKRDIPIWLQDGEG